MIFGDCLKFKPRPNGSPSTSHRDLVWRRRQPSSVITKPAVTSSEQLSLHSLVLPPALAGINDIVAKKSTGFPSKGNSTWLQVNELHGSFNTSGQTQRASHAALLGQRCHTLPYLVPGLRSCKTPPVASAA